MPRPQSGRDGDVWEYGSEFWCGNAAHSATHTVLQAAVDAESHGFGQLWPLEQPKDLTVALSLLGMKGGPIRAL